MSVRNSSSESSDNLGKVNGRVKRRQLPAQLSPSAEEAAVLVRFDFDHQYLLRQVRNSVIRSKRVVEELRSIASVSLLKKGPITQRVLDPGGD